MTSTADMWATVGLTDPAPGRPVDARSLSGRYNALALDLRDTAAALRGMSDTGESWLGAAADAFRSRLPEPPRDLDIVAGACERAVRALAAYATKVEAAQGSAAGVLAQVSTARERLRQAATDVYTGTDAGAAVTEAQESLREAQARWEDVRREHTEAARGCGAELTQATIDLSTVLPGGLAGSLQNLHNLLDWWKRSDASTIVAGGTSAYGAFSTFRDARKEFLKFSLEMKARNGDPTALSRLDALKKAEAAGGTGWISRKLDPLKKAVGSVSKVLGPVMAPFNIAQGYRRLADPKHGDSWAGGVERVVGAVQIVGGVATITAAVLAATGVGAPAAAVVGGVARVAGGITAAYSLGEIVVENWDSITDVGGKVADGVGKIADDVADKAGDVLGSLAPGRLQQSFERLGRIF